MSSSGEIHMSGISVRRVPGTVAVGGRVRVPGVRLDPVVAGEPRVGSRVCAGCARRTSVTAGTVFAGTRSPLTQWFAAAWHVCATKMGSDPMGDKAYRQRISAWVEQQWAEKDSLIDELLREAQNVPG